MNREEALKLVADFIKNNKDLAESFELTLPKIWNRTHVINGSDRNGSIVFEVERHSGIFGDRYVPGFPLGSFITYWPRFEFDLKKKRLKYLGEVQPRSVFVNYQVIADSLTSGINFKFEPAGADSYQCTERITRREKLVIDDTDLKEFAGEIADVLLRRLDISRLDMVLSENKITATMLKLKRTVEAGVFEKARSEWRITHKTIVE